MRRTTAFKALLGILAFGVVILIAGREWKQARELIAAAIVIGLFLAWLAIRLYRREKILG